MAQKSSGEIELGQGRTFRWMLQGDRIPEIYGWIERNYTIEKGTGGFWRTDDPQEAARRALSNFPAQLIEKELNQ